MDADKIVSSYQATTRRIDRLRVYLSTTEPEDEPRWYARWLLHLYRFFWVLAFQSKDNQLWRRAAALTYTTILSLFPLIILLTSIASVFYTPEQEEELVSFIEMRLMPPSTPGLLLTADQRAELDARTQQIGELVSQVRKMSDGYRRRAGGIGFVGFLGLILTSYILYNSIESAFEAAWETGRKRTLARSVMGFTVLVVFAPVVIGLSIIASSMLVSIVGGGSSNDAFIHDIRQNTPLASQSTPRWELGRGPLRMSFVADSTSTSGLQIPPIPMVDQPAIIAPEMQELREEPSTRVKFVKLLLSLLTPLFNSLMLAIAYRLIPQATVKPSAALIGGFTAGILWELAKVGFFYYIYLSASRRELFQSLGAVPIFLIWIYFTWIVFLLGSELAFMAQNFNRLARKHFQLVRFSVIDGRLYVALALLVADAFHKGERGLSREGLVSMMRIDLASFERMVSNMLRAGVLLQTDGERLVLARPSDQIRLSALLELGCDPVSLCERKTFVERPGIQESFAHLSERLRNSAGDSTLADLLPTAKTV